VGKYPSIVYFSTLSGSFAQDEFLGLNIRLSKRIESQYFHLLGVTFTLIKQCCNVDSYFFSVRRFRGYNPVQEVQTSF
jgi:hypothetical protein